MDSWTLFNQTGNGWAELSERRNVAPAVNSEEGRTTEHIIHASGTQEAPPLYHHIQYFTPGGSPGPSCTHIEYAGQYPESAPPTPGSLPQPCGGQVTQGTTPQSSAPHVRFIGPFPHRHDYSGTTTPDHPTAPHIEDIILEGPHETSPPQPRPPFRSRPSTPYPQSKHSTNDTPNHFDHAFAHALALSPNHPGASSSSSSSSNPTNIHATAPTPSTHDHTPTLPSQRARLAASNAPRARFTPFPHLPLPRTDLSSFTFIAGRLNLYIPAAARFRRTAFVDRDEVWDESAFWGDGRDEQVVAYAAVASATTTTAAAVGGSGGGSMSSTSDNDEEGEGGVAGDTDADADAEAGVVVVAADDDVDVDEDEDEYVLMEGWDASARFWKGRRDAAGGWVF